MNKVKYMVLPLLREMGLKMKYKIIEHGLNPDVIGAIASQV